MTPAVDVVIVSWNVRDELLACLDSLWASTGVGLRVTVVDNNSRDGSADAVAAAFPGAVLLRNPTNEGFARAVNRGLRRGTAPSVLLLNPDTRLPAAAIARLCHHLDRLPGHAAVAPRLVGEDGTPQHSVYPYPSLGLSLLLATGAQRLLPSSRRAALLLEGDWRSDADRDVPWAVGACLLARRSVLERVGPLDEGFFVYAEDLEWCHRATRAGHPVRFVPDVTVVHLGNRSGAQRYGDDRTAAWLRNTIRFGRRNRGRAWTAAYVVVNGAATVSRYAVASARMRVRPSAEAADRLRLWRGHARFYLGRSRPEPRQ